MESYRMKMGNGGMAALPPLPPSRLNRSSNQNSIPSPSSNSEKVQLIAPHWMDQSSTDLNLNIHGGSAKSTASEELTLNAPPKKESTDSKQILQGSEKDSSTEAKRLKRIVQSRQYSQKYRLKQLQYIAQLESEVKALQAEVTITSPRIKFIDRQNSLLRAENYSIKEKLTVFSGELMFKEAQYEELKRERNMLKEMYDAYQQRLLESLRNTTGGVSYQQVNMENLSQNPIDPSPVQQVGIFQKTNPFSMLES